MRRLIAAAILASLAFTATPAYATRTVASPYIDQGVLKLKWKGGYTTDDERESRDGAQQHKVDIEYGVTDRFSIESETDIQNAGGDDNTDVTATAVKAKVMFTEKGQNWLDIGARLTLERSLTDDPDSAELKLLLAHDNDKFRHIANLILDHEMGNDASNDTNFGFSWSSRYKWKKWLEPGFELYDNFGAINDRPDFEDQDHSIGPVAYGKLGENWKYEAGYLRGFSENAADGRFKAVIEYGIKF
jgi:hypothetical protein